MTARGKRMRAQAGTTLVELLVALTVTSVVLSGVATVVFEVYSISQEWSGRLALASESSLLPNALQADSHRYLPCGTGPGQLKLCLPSSSGVGQLAVTYDCGPGLPCTISRTDLIGGSALPQPLIRGLTQQPTFTTTCGPGGGGAVTGSIQVAGVKRAADNVPAAGFTVFFRSPSGTCA